MSRRRRRHRGEGEIGLGATIGVVAGFAAIACVVAGVMFYYFQRKEEVASLDPETFCPRKGPQSVTAVLIDRTDGINETQAAALTNFFDDWRDRVPEHGAFRVYEVSGGSGLSQPILSVCNPGGAENACSLDRHLPPMKERYETKFRQPVDALIKDMLRTGTAETSPIMEAVQAIAIRDFGPKTAEDKTLIVVSDLMQHTSDFSLYKQPPDVRSFRSGTHGQKLESDLRGVKTWVYLLHSSSAKQTGDVVQFWLDWLMLQGADLQAQRKVPG